jgi:hypothetical protein
MTLFSFGSNHGYARTNVFPDISEQCAVGWLLQLLYGQKAIEVPTAGCNTCTSKHYNFAREINSPGHPVVANLFELPKVSSRIGESAIKYPTHAS